MVYIIWRVDAWGCGTEYDVMVAQPERHDAQEQNPGKGTITSLLGLMTGHHNVPLLDSD